MRFIFFILFVIVLALAGVAWMGLSEGRMVVHEPQVINTTKAQQLREKLDPRNLEAGSRRNIKLSTRELNWVLASLLEEGPGGHAKASIGPGLIQVLYTRALPVPFRPYLNINLLISSDDGLPVLQGMKVGDRKLSRHWADWLMRRFLDVFYTEDAYAMLISSIEEFKPGQDRVSIVYHWQPETLGVRVSDSWGDMRDVLAIYQEYLATLVSSDKIAKGPLGDILQSMFSLAYTRSQDRDPVLENKAVLLTLASWARGNAQNPMLQDQSSRAVKPAFKVRLQKRRDTAKHFVISAAVSAQAGGSLADALGLYKEIKDTGRGSGFGFPDIAAGIAGKKFGVLATESDDSARYIQEMMSQGQPDSAYMPSVKDLPDHMNQQEFEKQFSHVGSPAYEKMLADIRYRAAAAPLYQDYPGD